jgi:hypothetical protein
MFAVGAATAAKPCSEAPSFVFFFLLGFSSIIHINYIKDMISLFNYISL